MTKLLQTEWTVPLVQRKPTKSPVLGIFGKSLGKFLFESWKERDKYIAPGCAVHLVKRH